MPLLTTLLSLIPALALAQGARPAISANDNRAAAGRLRNGVLTVRIEAVDGIWQPEGAVGPGLEVQAFAEAGRGPTIPGPLIRVPGGTEIRATVRNSLTKPLLIRGLHDRPSERPDSVDIAPGEAREFRFRVTTPGTYFYWGRTKADRNGLGIFEDGQLSGAIVVDPPGGAPPDRILFIDLWADSAQVPPGRPAPHTFVVNGLSWPHTERLTYTVGDTARLRVINASVAPHPMHLHGFYYRVESRGTSVRDTLYEPEARRLVVTERMGGGTTMSLTWVPTRHGNWVFHCHLIAHISPDQRLGQPHGAAGDGPRNHSFEGMAGLVTGIHVRPRAEGGAASAGQWTPRKLRLYVNARPNHFGDKPGLGYVLQKGTAAPAPDSILIPGSTVVLTRDEPVEIMVVNRTPERVTVHWHGIELESYYDGVGDWSGDVGRTAPPIAPGDSFVVRMTPDRAGTFIYHTHMEEAEQLNSGLYGPLIIVEPGQVIDTITDRIFLLGRGGPGPEAPPLFNGSVAPAPLDFKAGTTYRLRFINITPSDFEQVALVVDSTPQRWRAFAKDGASLPPRQATLRPATQLLGAGETYDFEFTPTAPGELVLEVTTLIRGRAPVVMRVPVRVQFQGASPP